MTSQGWITVPLGDELLEEARARAAALPIFENSHRQSAANEVGCIGEVVARDLMLNAGVRFDEIYATSHDFRLPNGKTIEIKTKDRTVPPRSDYECSIPLYNHPHQAVDYYLFVSLQRSPSGDQTTIGRYKKAFVVGAANAKMVADRGRTWEAGQVDPANGTRFWTACINLKIHDLVAPDVAFQSWRLASALDQ